MVVQSGTLTITGTVRMAEDARFEVKPNAKLVIDGGTITRSSGCFDSRWNGIYVSGTSSSSQTVNPTHFGTVELKNGAVVEHAKEALNNFGLTSGGSLDWGAFGGIIQATEATFRNNRRSAQFMAYTNTNSLGNPINDKGFFNRCTFTVDDDMTPGPGLYAHISHWATRGVDVIGCHFENVRTANGSPTGRGIGVYTLDAKLSVREHCASLPPFGQPCPPKHTTPSTFTGLQHGVEATAGSVVSVLNSAFVDNHRGVVLSAAEGSTVRENTFSPGLFGPTPVGLYIDQTSSYTVECNDFDDAGTAPLADSDHRYGIQSWNTGVASPIRHNTFTDLYVGAQASGSNRNVNGEGLQYLENTFDDNYVGIAVLPSGSLPNQGFRVVQGSFTVPAGNKFDAPTTLADIFNTSQPAYYCHHQCTMPGCTTTVWYPDPQLGIVHVNTSVNWSLWSCGAAGKSMVQYGDATQRQAEKEAELTALTDGGNTQQLLMHVTTTGHEADMEVYGTLMQRSPNLSEQVLLSAVERNAALPNAMLRDVLASNPQAGKSETVMTGLAERPQQLPEYMVWQVEEASRALSPMERLRAEVVQLASERKETADALVAGWLFPEDGQPVQRDSALALLTAKDDAHAHYRLALLHAEEGDAQAAAHHAERLGQLADGPGQEAAQRLSSLLTLLASASADGRGMGRLNEGELALLAELAEGEDAAARRADAIVAFLNDSVRHYPVLPLPLVQQQRRAAPTMEGMSSVNVFPNPGKEFITIDYSFEERSGDNLFEVMDMQGRTLLTQRLVGQRDQQVVDVRALAAGSYVYRVSQDGQTMRGGTFMVVRD